MTKVCNECGKEFLMTTEHFYAHKDNKDGFRNQCKSCCTKKQKQYRQQNQDIVAARKKLYAQQTSAHISEYHKQYRQTNREFIAEKKKEYQQVNKIRIAKLKKQYRQANLEHIAQRHKQYRQANKESLAKHQRQYVQDNKDRIKNRTRRYRQANMDKYLTYSQKHKALKRDLPHTLTSSQWKTTIQTFNNKCAYCGKQEPLTQDHFIPVTKGGGYTCENIVPACKRCNSSKGNRDFLEWFSRQDFYSKEREKILLSHLGYKSEGVRL